MFQVIRVNRLESEAVEPLGTKRKFWFTSEDGTRTLFKADDRGTGEDWAEKVTCELCALLGLPHVHYELATETMEKIPGVVCATCAPPPQELVLGNQLLLARDPAYLATASCRYKVNLHTVDAVTDVLSRLSPPMESWMIETPGTIKSALDVFVGYVMLDAWVANQDRHHENWGALRLHGRNHLAPTFDHGASLARNLRDEERLERLTTRDANRRIEHFVRRARSAFFAASGATRALTTVQAWRAFSKKAPIASTIWMTQLRKINEDAVYKPLLEVPPDRLSDIGREFTRRLLLENQRRILDGEEA